MLLLPLSSLEICINMMVSCTLESDSDPFFILHSPNRTKIAMLFSRIPSKCTFNKKTGDIVYLDWMPQCSSFYQCTNTYIITHWNLNKIVDILQAVFSNAISGKNVFILIEILLKLVPKVPSDNKLSLIQVMAWHLRIQVMAWYLSGSKPLPETLITHFIYADLHHKASMR